MFIKFEISPDNTVSGLYFGLGADNHARAEESDGWTRRPWRRRHAVIGSHHERSQGSRVAVPARPSYSLLRSWYA